MTATKSICIIQLMKTKSVFIVLFRFYRVYDIVGVLFVCFQRQFLKRLAILFIHLVMLSMAIYLRPDDHDDPLIGGTSTQDIMRYCFELGTIGGVLHYLIFQQGEEIKNQGLISFLKQLVLKKFIFSLILNCEYIIKFKIIFYFFLVT